MNKYQKEIVDGLKQEADRLSRLAEAAERENDKVDATQCRQEALSIKRRIRRIEIS